MVNHKFIRGQTPLALYAATLQYLLTPSPEIRLTKSPNLIKINSYHMVLEAEEVVPDLALTDIGYTRKRWALFLTQYLPDLRKIHAFVDQVVSAKYDRQPGYTFTAAQEQHYGGSCLLGVSTNQQKDFITLVLHSRASMFAPTGVLDLNFATALATAIQEKLRKPKRIRLVWHIDYIRTNTINLLPMVARLNLWDVSSGEVMDTIRSHAEHAEQGGKQKRVAFQRHYIRYLNYVQTGQLSSDVLPFYGKLLR